MLVLTGTLINVFKTQGGTNKKGEEYQGREKLQVMGQEQLSNGESKAALIEITCEDCQAWKSQLQKQVEIPVTAFARGGQIYLKTAAMPKA